MGDLGNRLGMSILRKNGKLGCMGRKQRGHRRGLMCGSVGSCADAEKGALSSLGEAAVGVLRQGAGWRGVGFSANSLMGGVEYATVCLLKGAHRAVW
jgi:hypothetical protein